MYFMLSPRAHFILYTLQGTGGLGPGPGDGIPGKIGEGNRLQAAADGFFLQYSLTDTPLLHARHCAVIAWQQMRGTIGTHFPQQFPLLGSAFNNLSPRLHIGFMHITVAQIFGFGGRTGTHTNTGGQRAGDRSFSDNKALRAFALTLPPFAALALAKPSLLLFLR